MNVNIYRIPTNLYAGYRLPVIKPRAPSAPRLTVLIQPFVITLKVRVPKIIHLPRVAACLQIQLHVRRGSVILA